MARIKHWLKPIKSQSLPEVVTILEILGNHAVTDEKKGITHETFRLGVVRQARVRNGGYTNWQDTILRSPSDLLASLQYQLRKHTRGWVIGYRLSRLLVLGGVLDALENGQVTMIGGNGSRWRGYCITGDPPTVISCRLNGHSGTLLFCDVLNYHNGAFTDLAIMTGTEEVPEPDPWGNINEQVEYLKHKVGVISGWFERTINVVRSLSLGPFATTLAKQSWNGWRTTLREKTVLVHDDQRALDLERQAYFGGRSECYRLGRLGMMLDTGHEGPTGKRQFGIVLNETPIYHLDFNSCYPSVMAENKMPTVLWNYYENISVDSLPEIPTSMVAIARVRINATKNTYPIRQAGRVLFCRGDFVTTLCGPELMQAALANEVSKIYAIAAYRTANIFGEYVNLLYSARLAAKLRGCNVEATYCKYLLDSLYGKFGQKRNCWTDSPADDWRQAWGEASEHNNDNGMSSLVRFVGWKAERTTPLLRTARELDPSTGLTQEYHYPLWAEHRDSCPAIAAYITSLARVKLMNAVDAAGPDDVYYVDQDSLMTNSRGLSRLRALGMVDQHRLGALKVEAGYQWVNIHGIKAYETDLGCVLSGLPADSVRLESGAYVWQQTDRMQSIIGQSPDGELRSSERRVWRPFNYQHGKVLPDGRVEPFVLNQ